jgi:hypothetical protein
MRRLQCSVALAAIVSTVCLTATLQAATIFSDDFENEPITSFTSSLPTMTGSDIGGSWSTAQLAATTSFISANPESELANSSNAALSTYRFGSAPPIDPPAGATGIKTMVALMSPQATALVAANGGATVSFKIYDPSTAVEPGFNTGLSLIVNNHPFAATGAPITNPQLLGAKYSATGLSFRDGNIREEPTSTVLATYSLSDWHEITVDLDYAAQKFTFSVDNAFTSAPINFVHQTPEDKSLTNIWFGHFGAGSHFYLDDVVVTTVPEPSAVALFVLFSLLVSGCVRSNGNRWEIC